MSLLLDTNVLVAVTRLQSDTLLDPMDTLLAAADAIDATSSPSTAN